MFLFRWTAPSRLRSQQCLVVKAPDNKNSNHLLAPSWESYSFSSSWTGLSLHCQNFQTPCLLVSPRLLPMTLISKNCRDFSPDIYAWEGPEATALKEQGPKITLGKGQPPGPLYDSPSWNKLPSILEGTIKHPIYKHLEDNNTAKEKITNVLLASISPITPSSFPFFFFYRIRGIVDKEGAVCDISWLQQAWQPPEQAKKRWWMLNHHQDASKSCNQQIPTCQDGGFSGLLPQPASVPWSLRCFN